MSNRRLLENNSSYRLLEDGVSFRLLESQVTCSAPTGIGTTGEVYSSTMVGSGGTGPYVITLNSGSLPTGLSLATNIISGTPTVVGSFTFSVLITDNAGITDIETFTITITSPPNSMSGIYMIVPDQKYDTLYTDISDPNNPTSTDFKIPNPYFDTYLIGDDSNENVLHFAAYRIRVVGSGILRATIKSLDSVRTKVFPNLTLSSTPGKENTKLINFQGQRAQIRFEVRNLGEYFNINRIIVFVKEIWKSYHG